jgi:cobalt/nickel transport system permease protein
MQPALLDRYQAGSSILHRLDPRVKIGVAVLAIFSNALLPDGAWLAFVLTWALLVAATWLAGMGYGYLFSRSLVAIPFVLVAVTSIFVIPGQPLATFPLGRWQLVVTDAGLLRFASIVARSWLSVQVAILLVATTRFPDLLHGLQHLRVPAQMVAIVSFMYRYLFVLSEEVTRLLRAREARSARAASGAGRSGPGAIWWQAQVAGNMAGQLFLRSYERSGRIYDAMLARGYRGHILTLTPHTMQRRDWAAGGLALSLLLLVQLVGQMSLI